jgi:iron complex outermembrane receptor protein
MRTHTTATALLFAAAAAVVGGGLARAQEDDVVELNPLTIAGSREAGAAAGTLQTLTPDLRPGGAGALPTLAGQLAGLPGVVMQESFGGFDPPRLTLRGSGLQSAPVSRGVGWSLDGLPLNATDGSFTSAAIDPSLIGRIAVTPGSADPLAAASALGGALHLASPSSEAPARAWLSLGEQGFVRTGIAGGIAGDPVEAWGGLSYAAWDGWRPQSAQERVAVSGAIGRQFGAHGPAVRLAVFAANPQLDVPGPLTYGAALTQPGTVSALVAADRPRRETDLARFALDLSWAHEVDDFTRLSLAVQHTDDWFRQLRANGVSDTTGADRTLLLETRRTLGGHALHTGLLVRSGARDQTRQLNTGGTPGAAFADLVLDADQAVIWLDDRWTFAPGLTLEAGLSFVDATRESSGTPAGAEGRFEERSTAPRLGLAWQAHPGVRLSARAARGVEAPTFDDLLATRGAPAALTVAWTPLRAQCSDTLELGASGEIGPLAYSCTVYQAAWDGELLRLADANGAPRGTVNAGRTDHAGVEAALRWRILGDTSRALDLTLAHTWSRARFDDDPVYRGRDIAGLPPHAGSAQLTWAGDHGLFATAGATWIGGTTWADHANTLGFSGYTIASLRLGWADRRGWSVFVDADNLFDHAFIASTSGVIDLARNPAATALFLPGLPRQVRCGISWRR